MYGYIYKTTNLVNGKIYIGQHKSEKFEPEIYLGSGTLFRRALQRYGRNNFTQQLLCECMNQQEMNAKEKYYIQKYNATDIKVGYNLSVGGIGGSHSAWNKGLTKETDERVAKYTSSRRNSFKGNFGMSNGNAKKSEAHLYEILPYFEEYWKVHHTQEVYKHFHIGRSTYLKCINILNLNEKDNDRQNYLKQRSLDSWRASNKHIFGEFKILCVETGEIFNTVAEVNEYLGKPLNAVMYKTFRNPNRKYGGYHFKQLFI